MIFIGLTTRECNGVVLTDIEQGGWQLVGMETHQITEAVPVH